MSNARRNLFKSKVRTATKSGGIPNTYDGFFYESSAGWVSLPFAGVCTESGFGMISPREFVYGVFIDKATQITDGTVGTAASELFREPIREALKSWKNCPNIQTTIRPTRRASVAGNVTRAQGERATPWVNALVNRHSPL